MYRCFILENVEGIKMEDSHGSRGIDEVMRPGPRGTRRLCRLHFRQGGCERQPRPSKSGPWLRADAARGLMFDSSGSTT